MLSQDHDGDAPKIVKVAGEFCDSRNIWYKLSRNSKVLSCKDAASRRLRLGAIGIPLSDELRSYAIEVFCGDGPARLALLHCRADRGFDFEKLTEVGPITSIKEEKARLNEFADSVTGYGLVNPFTAQHSFGGAIDVLQIFDRSLFDVRHSETGTMMTNAGDHTWAIEFDPMALKAIVDDDEIFIADISIGDARNQDERRAFSKLAIITGNAPESGMLLWQKVNKEVVRLKGDRFKGDVSFPNVVVSSNPWMGLSMELDERSTHFKDRLFKEVDRMINLDADLLAIACNTTQVFGPAVSDIASEHSKYFCGLPSLVTGWLKTLPEGEKVYIAGIGHVTKNSDLSAFRELHNFSSTVFPSELESEKISELAFEIKQSGPTSKANQKLRGILNRSGCKYALLLLTELSMVFDQFPRLNKTDAIVVDALDLYAKELARRLVSDDF